MLTFFYIFDKFLYFSIANKKVSKPLFGAFLQRLPKVSTFAPSKQKY